MNFAISTDTHDNRYISPEYTDPFVIEGEKLDRENPSIEIQDGVFSELVQASKANNQNRINEILARYI